MLPEQGRKHWPLAVSHWKPLEAPPQSETLRQPQTPLVQVAPPQSAAVEQAAKQKPPRVASGEFGMQAMPEGQPVVGAPGLQPGVQSEMPSESPVGRNEQTAPPGQPRPSEPQRAVQRGVPASSSKHSSPAAQEPCSSVELVRVQVWPMSPVVGTNGVGAGQKPLPPLELEERLPVVPEPLVEPEPVVPLPEEEPLREPELEPVIVPPVLPLPEEEPLAELATVVLPEEPLLREPLEALEAVLPVDEAEAVEVAEVLEAAVAPVPEVVELLESLPPLHAVRARAATSAGRA